MISKYTSNTSIIVQGDFYLPDLKWLCNDNGFIINESGINLAREILDMVNFLNLYQHNYIHNHQNRILDLVISNQPNSSIVKSNDPLLPVDDYHP